MTNKIQKFVRIIMRDKTSVVLPFEKAQDVLESTEQIVMIRDDKKDEWSGQSLNKADIVRTERCYDTERHMNREQIENLLPDAKNKVDISLYRPKWMNND